MKKGFTLIELLVVVLIIGILAAIALPQYQRAVFKSRMAEAFINLKTLKNGLEMCELENGRATSDNLYTNVCWDKANWGVQVSEQDFHYNMDRGELSLESVPVAAANTQQEICICIHDDGHFSTPSPGDAVGRGCAGEGYPNFNVAQVLGISEDDDCTCC